MLSVKELSTIDYNMRKWISLFLRHCAAHKTTLQGKKCGEENQKKIREIRKKIPKEWLAHEDVRINMAFLDLKSTVNDLQEKKRFSRTCQTILVSYPPMPGWSYIFTTVNSL